VKVWLDVEQLGRHGLFADLADGLSASKVVVAFISDEYAKSDNCSMELHHVSKNLRKKLIICVVGASNSLSWCAGHVGLLVAPYQAVLMRNEVEYKAHLQTLMDLVRANLADEPSVSIPKAVSVGTSIDIVQDKIEELQRAFLGEVSMMDKEANFPRVFSIWWNGMEKMGCQLRFLCEFPGAWHFVGGTNSDDSPSIFTIAKPALFVQSVASYLYPLAQILQESSICTPTLALHAPVGENKREVIAKLKGFFKEFLKLSEDSVADVEKCVKPLRRVVFPTGEIRWLCDIHNSNNTDHEDM